MHMQRVITFFDEKGEDGMKTKTEVTRADTVVTRNCNQKSDGYDVGRRDLLVVEFHCEHCSRQAEAKNEKIPSFKLQLMQHKGSTLVSWE